MYRYILLAFISLQLSALEISIDSAEDNFEKYAILQLVNPEDFLCQEMKDDFGVVREVVCAFKKQPREPLPHLQNDFFSIDSFMKKGTFFLSVKPRKKLKLYGDVFNLTQDDTVFSADVTLAKRWTIVGFGKNLPLINKSKRVPNSINFPFYLAEDKMPYVGSLDLKGNPVYIKKVADVKDYLKIKEYFNKGRYSDALDLIEETLSSYPNTLFKSELLFYKIKSLNRLKDYEGVIENAKIYLQEYSGDENIPEVLSLIAKAYGKLGQNSDADYFFDRLFSEHPQSLYTQWGYIYKGEMLEDAGGNSKAIEFYKRALYETQNLPLAASAAYHLANILLNERPKKAAEYARKIIAADPTFFMQNIEKSMKMMQAFAEHKQYKTAAAIADALLKSMGPTYDEYEELLKDKALWLAKTDDKKAAIKAINDYIKKFPDGDYINVVESLKDELLFERDDLNTTQKLKEYDKLIKEYAPDSIAQKALYEKARLLLDLKRYEDVLALKNELEKLDKESYPDVDAIIKEAAEGVMQASLQKRACDDVLMIANDYNITISQKWDDGLYSCAMKGGDFRLAKSIAEKNLHAKNIEDQKKWLYRFVKIDFATGNYTELVSAAKDLSLLIENPKKSPYRDLYRYLFDAYSRLGEKDAMIKTMAKIEEIFGPSYKDLDRYAQMVALGSELKDNNLIIKYAEEILKIQNRIKAYPQSPFVEFTLFDAYMHLERYKDALRVIKELNRVELSKQERARQQYLLGMVLRKLWREDEAKKAYEAAIKADPASAWAKLAKSALEL